MAIESIALIPSGVKATKVYSQLPVDGNGDFTFDRGASTTQTRVNKDGLIEDVAQDVPRLDYLDGGCPSLLLEPATTNLITYSEDFTNAAWSKTGIGTGSVPVVTANQGISPKGDLTADRVQFDLGGGTAFGDVSILSDTVTVSSAATTTKSVYIKSNNGSNQNIIIYETTDVNNRLEVLVTTEWQRFELTNAVSGTSSGISIGLRNVATGLTIDDTADILVWGAQLEELSYATSYIPTSGSTETRSAETCNGAGSTTEINSTEGVLYAEIRALADDNQEKRLGIGKTGTFDAVRITYTPTSNSITAVVNVSGNQYQYAYISVDRTDYQKLALKYKQNDFAFYVNGLKVNAQLGSGNTASANHFNTLAFDVNGGINFYGRCKRLSVYDSALTDSQLETLTGFSSFAEMASYLSYS